MRACVSPLTIPEAAPRAFLAESAAPSSSSNMRHSGVLGARNSPTLSLNSGDTGDYFGAKLLILILAGLEASSSRRRYSRATLARIDPARWQFMACGDAMLYGTK